MQRKRQLALILATITSMFMLSVVPVAAEQNGTSGDDSTSGSVTTTTTNNEQNEQEASDPTTDTEVKAEVQSIREKAKEMLQTDRTTVQEHSLQARQKSCDARKAEIDGRVNNYATAAQNHLNVFEGILTKVQAFYTSKQLNVATYGTLFANAQSKQTAAQQAVDALKALNVTIDCTSSDPAQSVAAVKAAVVNARTALQAYRMAIKDLIVAIEGASTAQTNTTTTPTNGGTQQ